MGSGILQVSGGLLRDKKRPWGILLSHRMCDAIDRGYYCSVAPHSGRKKRVEHTFNGPAFHESTKLASVLLSFQSTDEMLHALNVWGLML